MAEAQEQVDLLEVTRPSPEIVPVAQSRVESGDGDPKLWSTTACPMGNWFLEPHRVSGQWFGRGKSPGSVKI